MNSLASKSQSSVRRNRPEPRPRKIHGKAGRTYGVRGLNSPTKIKRTPRRSGFHATPSRSLISAAAEAAGATGGNLDTSTGRSPTGSSPGGSSSDMGASLGQPARVYVHRPRAMPGHHQF